MKATELRIGNTVFYNSENDNNEPVRYYCTINGADLRIMQDDEKRYSNAIVRFRLDTSRVNLYK